MNWAIVALLVGVGAFAVGHRHRRLRAGELPDVLEEDFLGAFSADVYPEHVELIRAQRLRVSKVLGIPTNKLDPGLTYDDLRKRLGFLGEFEVSWSDLEFDLREECLSAGTPFSQEMMTTVGKYIEAYVRTRSLVSPGGEARPDLDT